MSEGNASAISSKRSSIMSQKRTTLAPLRSNLSTNETKVRTVIKPGYTFLPDLNLSKQSFSEQGSMVSDQDLDLDEDGIDEMNHKFADLLQSIVSKAGELMHDWTEVQQATEVIKLGKTGDSFKSQPKGSEPEEPSSLKTERVQKESLMNKIAANTKLQGTIKGTESLSKKPKLDPKSTHQAGAPGLGVSGQGIGTGSINDNHSVASKSSSKNSFQIRGNSLATNSQRGGVKQRTLSRPLK